MNIEALRKEVIAYIETEMMLMPLAAKDLYKAEHGTVEELIELAKECGIDVGKYL